MKTIVGLAPIAAPDAVTLVLGSMPSELSLSVGQYYANPRNAFWPIMGELVDAGLNRSYNEPVERLTAAKIAVWDVFRSCVRKGSLDRAIANEEPNDFVEFLRAHPLVTQVFFNGGTAEKAFLRHVRPLPALALSGLPSTSPAHAR